MSRNYPVIAITGSSGAGTTSVMNSFQHIFRRDGVKAQMIEGDSMHRYERKEMDAELAKHNLIPGNPFSHFSPKANLLPELAGTFDEFGKTGKCKVRKYVHTDEEGKPFNQRAGTLTPWQDSDTEAEVLFTKVCMVAMWGQMLMLPSMLTYWWAWYRLSILSGYKKGIGTRKYAVTQRRQ